MLNSKVFQFYSLVQKISIGLIYPHSRFSNMLHKLGIF